MSTQMSSFDESTIIPEQIKEAIRQMGFEKPTEVQAKAIPAALEGRDLLVSSQTGSGKTVAFLVPVLTRLIENKDLTALVIVPTRELAMQVHEVLMDLTDSAQSITGVVLVGGVSMTGQLHRLQRGPRVIIGTPGRLLDHVRRRTVNLQKVNFCILDEADRMFDMGFITQLRDIVSKLPTERQNLLFSATFPPEIKKLAQTMLRNPVEIAMQKVQAAPVEIDQRVLEVSQQMKNEELLNTLNATEGSALVFARTQHRADRLARYLDSYGIKVSLIHGGRTQGQRNRGLADFRDGTSRVLVATDIASRGIDVPHVAYVVNYDLPQCPEDYIHRIGRTGRAGQKGQALSFVTPEDSKAWSWIQGKSDGAGLNLAPRRGKGRPSSNNGRTFGSGGKRRPSGNGKGQSFKGAPHERGESPKSMNARRGANRRPAGKGSLREQAQARYS